MAANLSNLQKKIVKNSTRAKGILDRLYFADQQFPLEVGPNHVFASASADREDLHNLIAVARVAEQVLSNGKLSELGEALTPLLGTTPSIYGGMPLPHGLDCRCLTCAPEERSLAEAVEMIRSALWAGSKVAVNPELEKGEVALSALRARISQSYDRGYDAGIGRVRDEIVCSVCGKDHNSDQSEACRGCEAVTFMKYVKRLQARFAAAEAALALEEEWDV